jgi:hypothetical protein
MRQRTRIIVGGLTVAIALAAAVNTATARRIEVSEQHFLVLFRELTFEAAGNQLVCSVNIEGSFHSRTISKVSGQLIGYITEAIVNGHPCIRNNLWLLNGIENPQNAGAVQTLPWHILYLNFRGELPRITEIELKLIGVALRFEILGILCLYKTTPTKWMEGQIRVEAGRVTHLVVNEERRIPLLESQSGAFCPAEFIMRGEGQVGTQTGWREIFVRLVQ